MSWIAPVAADAHRKQEEAEMVKRLSEADPEGKFEFKIIRAGLNAFKKEDYLNQVLDKELQGGWELAAKIDDSRIILRRPIASRKKDMHLDPEYDPYRTNYGSTSANTLGILIGLVVLTGLMFLGGYLNMRQETGIGSQRAPILIFIVLVMVFVLFVVVIIKLKRK